MIAVSSGRLNQPKSKGAAAPAGAALAASWAMVGTAAVDMVVGRLPDHINWVFKQCRAAVQLVTWPRRAASTLQAALTLDLRPCR